MVADPVRRRSAHVEAGPGYPYGPAVVPRDRRRTIPGEASPPIVMEFAVADLAGSEIQSSQLGLWAVGWVLPRELTFSRVVIEPRLDWLLEAYGTWLRRFKAVFRTGPGPSWLIQGGGRGVRGEDSAYRL